MTMVETIQQWDIDTQESLAAFQQESLEVLQKVDRAIYLIHLITDSDYPLNPYCNRDEFINWVAKEMEDTGTITDRIGRCGVIVRMKLIHRDGRPVRAEFRQEYGDFLDSLEDPNAGGIIQEWYHEFEGYYYLVEEEDGKVRMDYQLYQERNGQGKPTGSRFTQT